MQIRTPRGNIFLEADEVQKLREHLNEAVITELKKHATECAGFEEEDWYDHVISLIRDGVK